MILIERIAGNVDDPQWRARLDGADVDLLMLDQWDAQKSRLRKTTAGGAEIALSLDRAAHLRDGDVLVWNAETRRAIVARIELNDVMVIELDHVVGEGPEVVVRTMFELGHALGNQHWPAVVKERRIFVPLTVDRSVMASVMKTHAFPGIHHKFVPGLEVIPYMTPHEARRLFGGASAPSHSHPHDHDHPHPHAHDHQSSHHVGAHRGT